jgi:outer membrane protein TolC
MVDLGAMQRDYEKKVSKVKIARDRMKSLLAQYDKSVLVMRQAYSEQYEALNKLQHATRAVTNS